MKYKIQLITNSIYEHNLAYKTRTAPTWSKTLYSVLTYSHPHHRLVYFTAHLHTPFLAWWQSTAVFWHNRTLLSWGEEIKLLFKLTMCFLWIFSLLSICFSCPSPSPSESNSIKTILSRSHIFIYVCTETQRVPTSTRYICKRLMTETHSSVNRNKRLNVLNYCSWCATSLK